MGFRYCGGAKVLRIRNPISWALFSSSCQTRSLHPVILRLIIHARRAPGASPFGLAATVLTPSAPVASVQRRHCHDSLRMFKKRREDIIAAILLAAWPRATRRMRNGPSKSSSARARKQYYAM
ncbi:hypothetical protein Q7P35_006804 [Cladosporium inversicolor]